MALIEETLFSRLRENTTVSGLVNNRIIPINLPDDPVYPTITYNRISTEHMHTVPGVPFDLKRAVFQFSVWSDDFDEIILVASGVRDALDGQQNTRILNQVDLFDTTTRKHYSNLDFEIAYTSD